MKEPIKPLFEEKDIPLLDEILRRLKNNKTCTSDALAEYEGLQSLSGKEKVEHYLPYFVIYGRYFTCRHWIDKQRYLLAFKSYNQSEVVTQFKRGGFSAIYDEYLADVNEWNRHNMLRQEEIDRAKITHHQARNINWDKWRSVIALVISFGALVVAIIAFFKE